MDHETTATFEEVDATTDTNMLWAWAFECGVDPARPEECPSCLAYVKVQDIEDERRENQNLEVSEPPC